VVSKEEFRGIHWPNSGIVATSPPTPPVDERESMLWVITVYIPSVDEWDEGFNRRKAQ